MLTLVDFDPVSVQDLSVVIPLTSQKALAGLVYRSSAYKQCAGYYGNVYAKIKAAVAAGVVALAVPVIDRTETQLEELATAMTLAAVAYRLSRTPKIAVVSFGNEQARSEFSSQENWEELALDVLDNLVLPLGSAGSTTDNAFIVTDRILLDTRNCQYADEAMMVMGRRYLRPYIIGRIGGY